MCWSVSVNLKVNDILKLQELKFYYKFKNNKLPHYLQSLPFYTNIETHNYATHTQHNIHQPICKHTFAKNCVCFNIPITINTSPTCILYKVYIHNLHGFSGCIKAHILQSYRENCILVDCYVCT